MTYSCRWPDSFIHGCDIHFLTRKLNLCVSHINGGWSVSSWWPIRWNTWLTSTLQSLINCSEHLNTLFMRKTILLTFFSQPNPLIKEDAASITCAEKWTKWLKVTFTLRDMGRCFKMHFWFCYSYWCKSLKWFAEFCVWLYMPYWKHICTCVADLRCIRVAMSTHRLHFYSCLHFSYIPNYPSQK